MIVLFLGVITALLSNCAPVVAAASPPLPAEPPVPVRLALLPVTDLTEDERCLAIIDALCMRVEKCGFATEDKCFKAEAAGCLTVTGISVAEADTCRQAMMNLACDGGYPHECMGIGEDTRMPEPPARSPRDI
jgi:hypothetical protein